MNQKVRPARGYFSGASNRTAVTVRLNLAEQGNMNSLMEFYSLSAKDVMKLAFEQLATATDQLQQKLKLAEEQNENETSNPDSSGDPTPDKSGSGDSTSDGTTASATAGQDSSGEQPDTSNTAPAVAAG